MRLFQYALSNISIKLFLWILGTIIVLLLIFMIQRALNHKKAENHLKESETELDDIHNNSFSYIMLKFNKAKSFSFANEGVVDSIKKISQEVSECQKSMDNCDELFAKADSYLDANRIHKANRFMDQLDEELENLSNGIDTLNQELDSILSCELEVHKKFNDLKAQYRAIKKNYVEHKIQFYGADSYIEGEMLKIERGLFNLEDLISTNNIMDIDEGIRRISKYVSDFESKISKLPDLYEQAMVVFPEAVSKIEAKLLSMAKNNTDLGYLKADDKVAEINHKIEIAVSVLDHGKALSGERLLKEVGNQILSLNDEIQEEEKAHDVISGDVDFMYSKMDEIEKGLQEITDVYTNIRDHFGLEDWPQRFLVARQQLVELDERRKNIEHVLDTVMDQANSTEQQISKATADLTTAVNELKKYSKD